MRTSHYIAPFSIHQSAINRYHYEDLGASPAEVLGTTENEQLQDDLFYIAGLFKSESTLRGLIFQAEDS